MTEPLIEACGASLVYRDHGREVFAVQDLTFEVHPNEFLGILGPSGSGKSSLLYLLSGLKIPSSGEVRFAGRSLRSMSDEERSRMRLRDFGFVFQQAYLLGYLNALENVLVANPSGPSVREAQDLLERLDVAEKAGRLPHELSGGEKQRICVARALLGSPRVIFADEPTASLDHKNGSAVVRLLNQHRGEGALVMVTHDPSMLEEADRVIRIVDGKIEE